MPKRKQPVENFYKITTNCWNWIGGVSGKYGMYKFNGVSYLAHRFVYEKHKGTIPFGGHLDHLCKNKLCVNPEHLEVVDIKENTRRGRVTEINLEKANEIRTLYSSGKYLQRELGVMYNLTQSTVSSLLAGDTWR